NPRLVQECALSAGFSPKQLVVIGDRLGNTAAASVPIGLNTAVRDGRIHSGDTVLMMSFGAGMTWGWSLVTW
ncbi:3-oxoacyl-[acyl-carrier-protein] synthase III C-terminal domain-containing protein, partial [Frankia casuarinae]|uniref:3-oxoacyl-[acyl-carrier-protein] synthase III C-terminal domain-containing protein n=2 Tax=Frankia TaxID=1854 RepID=UPI0036F37571